MATDAATTTPPRGQPLGTLRWVLIAILLVLAAIAWAITNDRMQNMDAGPGTDLGALGWYAGVWVVMMAAMMFPSIVPMVLVHARIQRGRRERGQASGATTITFVAGYLISWAAFGLVAYGLYHLAKSIAPDALSWDQAGRWLAGGVIVAAALYELTPAKDACLTRCRSPLDFVLGGWRDGHLGALRLGVEHGFWCVGCCWGLMVALFAVGVMSVGWMLFIAALIALEKLAPWRKQAQLTVTLLLAVLGLGVALWPSHVPGLVVPGSAEAHDAEMHMME
jgi:predicted metal-binding membrane protein